MFLLVMNNGFAQNGYNFFYGKVVDQVTRRPLVNVNLSVPGTTTGTVSGKKGEFSFFIDSIPSSLVVSHVGYISKNILLDNTSFSLTIYLSPSVKELAEVEIKANSHEAFFKDEHYAVLDYEIDSDFVYLLIFKRYLSRSELICKSIYGDTIATSIPFYFRPDKLFKDCLGTLHVLSRDSGFQVFRQDKFLHIIHPVNLKKFDDVLKNCVAASPEVLYFQRFTDHGQGIEYYGINIETLEKSLITRIGNEQKLKMLRRNPEDEQWMRSAIQPSGRDDFVAWNYVHKILYRPIKTSLVRIGDFTCIFNTIERQMEFYDAEGAFSYKLALRTNNLNDGRWTSDIIVDERTGNVFTTFISNGLITLYQVDLNTGTLKIRAALVHQYPEKVRVYNDFIYYLYDEAADPDNKMLFRQKM
ncbi:MAG: carboxypeptidase-like regulatory domain-containing protein [Bacteroidales bacterium]